MLTRRWSSKAIWMRSGCSSGSICWVLLVSGRFPFSKTIIPDAKEHFPTHSPRRDAHPSGGLGLRRRMRDFNQIALYQNPVLVLADLDSLEDCAVNRVTALTGRISLSPNLLVRIAVLEVEAWILADRSSIANWLGIATTKVPQSVETLIDPKRALVELAGRSRSRGLRESIAPQSVRGSSRTGPRYNGALGEFVIQHWNPEVARRNSPSLDRAIMRIAELAAP